MCLIVLGMVEGTISGRVTGCVKQTVGVEPVVVNANLKFNQATSVGKKTIIITFLL